MRRTLGCFVFLVSVIATLVTDQASKFYLPTTALNSGVSLGLAAGWGSLPVATLLLLVGLTFWLMTTAIRSAWPWWGWSAAGLVVGGGASNVLDRWLIGSVRDPLPIPFTPLRNNLADYAIFLGLTFIFFVVILGQRQGKPLSQSHPSQKPNSDT